MIATANAFPPLHTFNSSRSWFLVLIVLVHLGFFWALTPGGLRVTTLPPPPMIVDFVKPALVDPQPIPLKPYDGTPDAVTVVDLDMPHAQVDDVDVITAPPRDPGLTATEDSDGPGSAVPLILEPQVDPRIGLTEPVYPVDQIRMQHEGTVVLSVQVLPNGRVGAVRIERSSGHARLDEAAVREARRWRLIPGTRDGTAVDMWKEIPITFRLRD
jgi:periplasmic protein TonB